LPISESKTSCCVKQIKSLLSKKKQQLALDLVSCCSMFSFLPAAIKSLESNSLELKEQLNVLDDVKNKLRLNRGNRGKIVKRKFDSVMAKNHGMLG
jgi:hypothetical protein